jgi:hypothetical protein
MLIEKELHDLDGCKMLASLRLRASFISGDEEQRGLHDGGSVSDGEERQSGMVQVIGFAQFYAARLSPRS